MKARVSSFESFATLDGTGIRFEIFFQGCNLRCNVCHNPETWDVFGKAEEYSVEDLITKVKRFKPYFKNNGGVTLSGGEPLLQTEFLLEFCEALKNENIHIALDTSGSVFNENVKTLLNYIDLVLLDLKHNSEENYLKYAKGSLIKTVSFLEYLDSIHKKTWIRTVVVPAINDNELEISKYLDLIRKYDCIEKYELLAFHTMGFHKYENLKIKNPLISSGSLTEEKRNSLQKYVNRELKK